jgi:hypothetical protein
MKHSSLFCDDCRSGGLKRQHRQDGLGTLKNNTLVGRFPILFEIFPLLAAIYDVTAITRLHILFLRFGEAY